MKCKCKHEVTTSLEWMRIKQAWLPVITVCNLHFYSHGSIISNPEPEPEPEEESEEPEEEEEGSYDPVTFTIVAGSWGDGFGMGFGDDQYDFITAGSITPDPVILLEEYQVRRVANVENGNNFCFTIDNYGLEQITPPVDSLIVSIRIVGGEDENAVDETYYTNEEGIFYSYAYNGGLYTVWSWPNRSTLQNGTQYSVTVNWA